MTRGTTQEAATLMDILIDGEASRARAGRTRAPARGLADLEIRQAGRGVRVRARAPWFDAWWHDAQTWADDPMGAIRASIAEDRDSK